MTPPTATSVDIGALEAGVLDRLRQKIENYAIESFPDDPASYKITHQRGAFLTAYRGADFAPVEDTGDVVQTRSMSIDVVVLCRQLTGSSRSGSASSGAYVMLDLARLVLAGWKLTGFTKLTPMRERFLGRTDAVWMYAITFRATTVAVELDDDEELGSVLEHLTMVSPFTTSEIPAS